jgi:(1->4)-alpha-D-glucan 1-alpha-D-glucosylmutase
VTWRTLQFRRDHEGLFLRGDYQPLEATGPRRDHVVAFARSVGDSAALVVAPRLVVRLAGGAERPPQGPEVWGKTGLLLPPLLAGRSYHNVFTGETLTPGSHASAGLLLGDALRRFPVALLGSLP